MVPVDEVEGGGGGGAEVGLEACDEVVDVGSQEVFLFSKGFFGESVAEETAHPAVVGVVGGEDAVFAAEGDGVFGEAGVTGAGAEDVFPGLRGGEGEFVRETRTMSLS